jgi:hypothetical protein
MTGKGTASFFVWLHAAVSITLAIIAGKPVERFDNLPFLIIMVANNYIALPLFTITILVAFAIQVRSSRGRKLARSSEASGPSSPSGALSTRALSLQSIAFLALAVSWPFRFGYPWGQLYDEWWVVTLWYPQVGWPCVNNAVIAVGQFVMLCVVSSADSDSAGSLSGERRALLDS